MSGGEPASEKMPNTDTEADLGEFILQQAEDFAFPPTEWEVETLGEVLTLPRVIVVRPPREQLLKDGMQHNHCHENCSKLAASYPGRIRHVSGWVIYGDMVILHSVVEVNGQLRCVTPQIAPAASRIAFIADPSIRWSEAPGGRMVPYRDGVELPNALRKYPEQHVRMRDELRNLIASGVTALEAQRIIDATLGAELRQWEPI